MNTEAANIAASEPPTFTASNSDLLQTNLLSSEAVSEENGSESETYDGSLWLDLGTQYRLTVSGGHSIQYTLDTSVNTYGYDITRIDLFSHWSIFGGGRSEQRFRLLVSYVGDPVTFFELAPLTHWTPDPVNGLIVQNSLTNDGGGVLDNGVNAATGIAAIRFEFGANSGGGANGADGANMYREIDVFGTPTVPEPASLALLCLGGLTLLRRRRPSCW